MNLQHRPVARRIAVVAAIVVLSRSQVRADVQSTPTRDLEASAPATAAPNLTIMDLRLLAAGTTDLVGRAVDLKNVRVLGMANAHGFFVDAPNGAIYVLPSIGSVPPMVVAGDVISISGVVAVAPRSMPGEFNPPVGWNRHIYVVATLVTK
jgi:hypothetical protein